MPKRSKSKRMQSAGQASAHRGAANPPGGWGRLVDGIIGVSLVLLVAVAYVQVLRFQFVNYDDSTYVPNNPQIRAGISLGGIRWAFTAFETANWYPLTWLSLMLDCQMFGGPWPGGHHAVNAALHAANAVLLFLVLRRMTGSRWRSAAVAALFAVHPLHVESVAWIAERKDVLSTLFFLLTLFAYQRYAALPSFRRWIPVFLGMALGLMTKSMLVTLPAVLLLLDVWPLKRVGGRPKERRTSKSESRDLKSEICDLKSKSPDLKSESPDLKSAICDLKSESPDPPSLLRLLSEKLPLLALSLAIATVTLVAQASKGTTTMLYGQAGLLVRLANAAMACARYLVMIVWPANLAVYYPYDFQPSLWQATGATLLLLAVTGGAVWYIRRLPYLAVGWLWYVGTLVPVIGLVQVGSQALADRYCYIPSIGIFLAFVWAVGDLARWLPWPEPKRRMVLAGAGSAILAAVLVVADLQISYWANSERLFRHALAITGENPMACGNLGDSLLHQGRYAEAEAQFRKVLAMDSAHYPQIPQALALALTGQGRIGEAVAFLRATVPGNPEKAATMNELAMFLASQGHVNEAIELLQEATELVPQQPLGLNNLAWIYANWPDRGVRNAAKAVKLARRACELSGWNNAQYRRTLADAYLEAGDSDRAIEELRAVEQLSPADPAAAQQLESIVRQRR